MKEKINYDNCMKRKCQKCKFYDECFKKKENKNIKNKEELYVSTSNKQIQRIKFKRQ